MPATPTVLCVGHVNWDVVLNTDTIPDPDNSTELINAPYAKCGGSATNTAIGLASLGVTPALIGSIGDDEYGQQVTHTLDGAGVHAELDIVEGGDTTIAYAVTTPDDDPRYLLRYGAVANFSVDDVDPDVWADIDHVHLTTLDREIASNFAETAKRDGKTVSFNPTQGYQHEDFTPAIDAADVIIMNDESEEPVFRARHDLDQQVDDGTCIVITHGSAGSTAHTPSGTVEHGGAQVDADNVVDTIGAGDSFVAGFLSSWLQNSNDDVDYEEALATGNACGAAAVQSVGAPLDLTTNRPDIEN